jgi:hypothetical protein
MYKELRSLGYSLLIILIYYYSAKGFTQLLWDDEDNNKTLPFLAYPHKPWWN